MAALSSSGPSCSGTLASIALARRRFRGKAVVTALLLGPLVIPFVVFGISLLILFHTLGIPRSILTVVIGHIVIRLPYTILVLVPRLKQIDASLEEAPRTSVRADCGRPVGDAPAHPARRSSRRS